MKRKLIACAAAAALALALAGCSSDEGQGTDQSRPSDAQQPAEGADSAEGAAYTFTDDMGNLVTVSNPQRVVACMGSFANIWELAGGELVGVSDDAFTFESFQIASPDVQTVGDFSSLNLEAIIALEPDFVIMTSGTGGRGGDSSQADLKPALDDSGIPVAYFEVTTFDDYLRMLRVCCDITGRDDLYQQNAQDVADRIAALTADVPEGEAPTVLLMTTYSGGARVQASTSQTGAMLADLGAVNLADQNRSLLSDFSLESIIDMNPDFILVVPMGNTTEAATKALEEMTSANPAWASLDAVQNGRYLTLEPNLFLYKPNSNWDQAYQQLYDILYA